MYGSAIQPCRLAEASVESAASTKAKVGLIGLGLMGQPIGMNLLKAGHALTVWNRTTSRAK
jgi:glutamyl-tRNA reductase